MRQSLWISLLALGLVVGLVPMSQASIIYTSDPTLSDFTSGLTFGEFIAGPFGDIPAPHTPTVADINAGLRIFGNDSLDPVIVQFANPVSMIRVFSNIDHPEAQYDGYQYAIAGSNDGINYNPLFDVTDVNELVAPFTIKTFSGTGPLTVNNVLTPGAGPSGTVGYIADFSFSQSYSFYKFTESTLASNQNNVEPEFSAVGTPVPEPSSLLLFAGSLALLAARGRKLLAR